MLARGDGPALLAEVRELDLDAPDYDRALVELAAFLQRVAIVQIVPEAALQDEEFDAGSLTGLGQLEDSAGAVAIPGPNAGARRRARSPSRLSAKAMGPIASRSPRFQ